MTADCARRLKGYSWPGNVRELHNVIERAVITANDGRLNWDRALPEASSLPPTHERSNEIPPNRIRTAKELEALERINILCALEVTDWTVSGEKDAAKLLGLNPLHAFLAHEGFEHSETPLTLVTRLAFVEPPSVPGLSSIREISGAVS